VRNRRSSRLVVLAVAALLAMPLTGCVHIGKIVGNFLTEATPELSNGAVQVLFQRNLAPAEANTTNIQSVGTENWRSGGNVIAVTIFKRDGVGLYKLEGAVLIDDKPATYWGNGTFASWVETIEERDYAVELKPSVGTPVRFTVRPPPPVKIKSVNGKPAGAVVDQGQPLAIELDVPAGDQRLMRVGLIKSPFPGISDFMDLAMVKAKPSLTIPAAAFAHSVNAPMAFDAGRNFLQVEAFDVQQSRQPGLAAGQVIVAAQDAVRVDVMGKPADTVPLVAKGKVDFPAGPISYEFSGHGAIHTAPLARARQVALSSLALRGTLLKTESSSSSTTAGNIRTTTTVTTTWKFPQLEDALWNELLARMETGISDVVAARTGGAVLPVERAVQARAYAEMEPIPEKNTDVRIEKTWKGSRALIPTKLEYILKNVRSTFAADRPEARMAAELGVDGQLDVMLDLQVGDRDGKVVLRPVLTVRMTGRPNGYLYGTTYFTGSVAGDGVPFSEADARTPGGLERIVRLPELLKGLEAALTSYAGQQGQQGYEAIWSLQD